MPRQIVRDFSTAFSIDNGQTDGVNVPLNFSLSQTAFTIAFWYKQRFPIPATVGTDRQTLFAQKGSVSLARQDANDMQMYIYVNAPNTYATPRRVRFGNLRALGATNASFSDGFNSNWHHRVYVLSVVGGIAQLQEYEDGVVTGAVKTPNYTGDASTPSGNFYLGSTVAISDIAQDYGTNTILDEFQIFNGVSFAASDVASLYNSGVVPSNPNLWWRFNEGTGTTINDVSGNGNNGTVTGGSFSNDVVMKNRLSANNQRLVKRNFTASLQNGTVNAVNNSLINIANGATISVWLKLNGPPLGDIVWRIFSSVNNAEWRLNVENTGKLFLWVSNPSGSGSLGAKTPISVYTRQWFKVLCTIDAANNCTIYVNGQYLYAGVANSTPITDSVILYPYGNNSVSMSHFQFWPRVFSATEILQDYYYSVPNATIYWKIGEGIGNTLYDSSTNNINASLTSPLWQYDTPVRPRQSQTAITFNGDFEFYPPAAANVATTSNNRVIDGTAGGSAQNLAGDNTQSTDVFRNFRWKLNAFNVTSPSAQYDTSVFHGGTASMKLSGTAVKERVDVTLASRIYPDLQYSQDIQQNTIPLQPNTTYTFSGWVKQNSANVVGSVTSTQGAKIVLSLHTQSNYTRGINLQPTNPFGTFDWTQLTTTFTTSSTEQYMNITLFIGGDSSNYYDATAWFDDLLLTPVGSTRQIVT